MKFKKVSARNRIISRETEPTDEFQDDDNFNGKKNSIFWTKLSKNCLKTDDGDSPVQRNSANARERARMRVLSSAFYRLKTIIPWVPHDTKLSKLDTLRLARNYIAYLSATLDGQSVNSGSAKMPMPQKMVSVLDLNTCFEVVH